MNVRSLTRRRLAKDPVEYTAVIRHHCQGVSVSVPGIGDTKQSRNAVADVLEAAARKLRGFGSLVDEGVVL